MSTYTAATRTRQACVDAAVGLACTARASVVRRHAHLTRQPRIHARVARVVDA